MKKTALLFLSALMLLCPLYSYAEMSPAEKAYGALGTKVEMGSYYIGNEDDNYTWEPIQWVICDVNEADGRCLLVSWQILDNVRFGSSMWGHATDAEIWLSDFIWNFSDEEREHIVPVELEDEEYPGTTAGLFRLFLLSGFDILTNQYVRETGPTWYAISQGCKGEWWLRSREPGTTHRYVQFMKKDGTMGYSTQPDGQRKGIRPAMWVEISWLFGDQ